MVGTDEIAFVVGDGVDLQHAAGSEVVSTSEGLSAADSCGSPSLRQQRLAAAIADGSVAAQAVGDGWLPFNPLPTRSRTETEAAYAVDSRPVYRCLFVPTG